MPYRVVPLSPGPDTVVPADTVAFPVQVGRLRVLVVDDDAQMRELIMVVLELAGCEPAEADGGDAALDYLRVNPPPDVVTTDLVMPGMSGLDFVRMLRSDPARAELPVLVVSGNADGPEGAEAATLANGMINKDAVVRDLMAAVREAIRTAPLSIAAARHDPIAAASAGPLAP